MFKLKNLLLKHYRVLSFICGGIAVLALPPFYKIWTLFPAFSLLLWYAGALVNPKQVFKSGY